MTSRRAKLLLAATAAVFATAAIAGSGASPISAGGEEPPTADIRLEDEEDPGTPVEGGILRLMLRLDADKFDPHVTTDTTGVVVGALVYEGLVENFRGEIRPSLAEEWEVSEDGLT